MFPHLIMWGKALGWEMMNIKIWLASEDEIPIVHKLMLEAFEEYRFLDVPSSALNETVDTLRTALENDLEQALLCSVEGVPLGSLRFTLTENSLYFSRVSVTPNARGKGIAKAMLAWLEKYAKDHNKIKMECRVRASLPKNINLYESMGYIFSQEEAVTNPNGYFVKTVVMEKSL